MIRIFDRFKIERQSSTESSSCNPGLSISRSAPVLEVDQSPHPDLSNLNSPVRSIWSINLSARNV